ncbi:hypothetical protein DFH07DRAFT_773617 [Mycena maculata]|uniref:Uncharacterized protein n=1 Tax=Mycena maculata TaxID=230809 RepID=A0AAD7J117_9AGAR|nr:hypothetical protein DFH07DRAFT_773617 [Mycena maculata]
MFKRKEVTDVTGAAIFIQFSQKSSSEMNGCGGNLSSTFPMLNPEKKWATRVHIDFPANFLGHCFYFGLIISKRSAITFGIKRSFWGLQICSIQMSVGAISAV